MKRFFVVFLVLALVGVMGLAMAEAVDAAPTGPVIAEEGQQPPNVAAIVLLYGIISVVMWYVIDWAKSLFLDHNLPETLYKVIMLVICVGIGLLLAFYFKVDAFVLVSALMRAIVPETPVFEPSTVGYVFGGLFFASGSAVVHKISEKLSVFKNGPTTE